MKTEYLSKEKKAIPGKTKQWLCLILSLLLVVCSGCSFLNKNDEEIQRYKLPVTVINQTGVNIYSIYASVSQKNEWEEDVLGYNNYLPAGGSVAIDFYFDSSHTVWDWMIEDLEGNTLEFYNLDFEGCSLSGATLILDAKGNATLYNN